MGHRYIVFVWILAVGLGMAAMVHAGPASAPARASVAASGPPMARKCGANQEQFRALRLTTISEDGVRVEYEFVRPGPGTWTKTNRPLLKQFGIRAGGTFCLPRDRLLAEVAVGP